MKCPSCGGATKVIDSRYQARDNETQRRRECLDCKSRITTVEQVFVRRSKSEVQLQNIIGELARHLLTIADDMKPVSRRRKKIHPAPTPVEDELTQLILDQERDNRRMQIQFGTSLDAPIRNKRKHD